MPTVRRKIARPMVGADMPPHVRWFLENRRLISREEAAALGFSEAEAFSILLMSDGGLEAEMRHLGIEPPS